MAETAATTVTQHTPPPQQGGGSLIQRLLGLNSAPDAELAAQLIRAEAAAALTAQQRIQLEEQAAVEKVNAEAALRKRELLDNAYYKLREALIGKKLDNTWQAYANNIIRDYLDSIHELTPRVRVEVIEGAIRQYIDSLHTEQHFSVEDILAMRAHNEHTRGEINTVKWWNPMTWHQQVSLSENANGSSRVPTLYSGAQVALLGLGAAAASLLPEFAPTSGLVLLPPGQHYNHCCLPP